ncbi:uncharacterized protein LOC143486742 [Brachyhypopomus gauderio]|uniref:uncharacterized protein LOC143486742 n=1 Tax=Brachyhypopomus gauderio TaxID=698409 RepID=UPI0040437368
MPLNVDRTLMILHKDGMEGLTDTEEIKKVHREIHSDELKSSRMYLWKHPATSLRLKQLLMPKFCHFSEENAIKLTEMIRAALKMGNDLQELDLVFDVMMPKVTINILMKHEGFSRYMAELFIASGSTLE